MIRFRVGDISVAASFWFFAVAALFTATNMNALAFFLVLPSVIHEAGHLIALALCGTGIKAVNFTAFGVEIKKNAAFAPGIIRELAVSLAGITANLLTALGLYLFAFSSVRMMLFISANLAVALFNLLPIGNLDGGETARILSEYFFKPRLAYILSRAFSFIALIPLFAAAIFLLLLPRRNFTLLLICCYLLVDIIKKS